MLPATCYNIVSIVPFHSASLNSTHEDFPFHLIYDTTFSRSIPMNMAPLTPWSARSSTSIV